MKNCEDSPSAVNDKIKREIAADKDKNQYWMP